MNQNDLNFAFKVRHALNENLDNLPTDATARLAAARKMAMSRKKKDSPIRVAAVQRAVAGQVGMFFQPVSWLGRIGLAIPVLILALGLFGLFEQEFEQRALDTADIDVAVLADELPLDAYLDHGFNAYLAKRD